MDADLNKIYSWYCDASWIVDEMANTHKRFADLADDLTADAKANNGRISIKALQAITKAIATTKSNFTDSLPEQKVPEYGPAFLARQLQKWFDNIDRLHTSYLKAVATGDYNEKETGEMLIDIIASFAKEAKSIGDAQTSMFKRKYAADKKELEELLSYMDDFSRLVK